MLKNKVSSVLLPFLVCVCGGGGGGGGVVVVVGGGGGGGSDRVHNLYFIH